MWLYDGRIHMPLSMMQEHFNMEGEFPLPILTSVYVNGQVGVGQGCGYLVHQRAGGSRLA